MARQGGGSWLFETGPAADVFSPEQLCEEHRLIARSAAEFVDAEVLPSLPRLERKDWTHARHLVRRCGELGLLGVDAPERYGGLALDVVASTVVTEQMARGASFSITFGGQANLCILPITWFGTDDQKQRYLPSLVAGERVGAYALSETGSGSDALAARTRAERQDDGTWLLAGEKTWISNGGFADLFIVFATTEDDRFTAFLVERNFPGVSTGPEEHKMGLHGSSTTSVVLQNVRVPAANVLGEVGRGHKVALNTLNFGRFKLGATCVGTAKAALRDAARYAADRRQFNRPIAEFGLIRHKLATMAVRIYAMESIVYRIAGLTSDAAHAGVATAHTFEEYAIEASIAKVFASEALDYVLDENVQIHGGNGYVADYPAERYFRDARVNRIFEGTNEINRLLIAGTFLRRVSSGDLPPFQSYQARQEGLLLPTKKAKLGSRTYQPTAPYGTDVDRPLDASRDSYELADLPAAEPCGVDGFRRVARWVLGIAEQRYGKTINEQQEILGFAADILIDTFAADSVVLRAQHALLSGHAAAPLQAAAARLFVSEATARLTTAATSALATMSEGDELRERLAALHRFTTAEPTNTVALGRQLAQAVTKGGGYILG